MPAPDVSTRIDQLKADLARVQAQNAAAVIVPSTEPLFHTDSEGAVRDAKGNQLRGPAPK